MDVGELLYLKKYMYIWLTPYQREKKKHLLSKFFQFVGFAVEAGRIDFNRRLPVLIRPVLISTRIQGCGSGSLTRVRSGFSWQSDPVYHFFLDGRIQIRFNSTRIRLPCPDIYRIYYIEFYIERKKLNLDVIYLHIVSGRQEKKTGSRFELYFVGRIWIQIFSWMSDLGQLQPDPQPWTFINSHKSVKPWLLHPDL